MTARCSPRARIVSTGILQAAILVALPGLTGCIGGGKTAPTTRAAIQTAPAAAAEGPSDALNVSGSEAPEQDVVGRQVKAYKEALEPLLNQKRAVPAVAPQPAETTADAEFAAIPSQVDWADPKALSLSDPMPARKADPRSSGKPTTLTKPSRPGAASLYQGESRLPVNGSQPGAMSPDAMKDLVTASTGRELIADAAPRPSDAAGNTMTAKGATAAPAAVAQSNLPLNLSNQIADVGERPNVSLPQTVAQLPLIPTNELQQKFSQRVKDYPRDVAAQLEYQMLLFVMNEPVPQTASLAQLPPEDRELVNSVIDGMSNFRNTLRLDNNMLLSRKIKPLVDLADRVRTQADLSIATVALCKNVNSFGNYDPIEPRFEAGREHEVILYCEVENFASQLGDKQRWETKLSEDVVLYTENGVQVWNASQTVNTDESRNRRRDFFLARKIKLSSKLVIGRYLLKVTVTDQQARRVAESTLPIVLVAQ